MRIDVYLKHIIDNPLTAIFYTPSYYEDSVTYLFPEKPEIIITANQSNFNKALKEVDICIQKDYSGFGFINYKAGYLLEDKLKGLLADEDKTLLKLFFYRKEKVKKAND